MDYFSKHLSSAYAEDGHCRTEAQIVIDGPSRCRRGLVVFVSRTSLAGITLVALWTAWTLPHLEHCHCLSRRLNGQLKRSRLLDGRLKIRHG